MNKINAPYISSLETLSDEALHQVLAGLESHSVCCVNWQEFPYKPFVTFKIAHSDKAVAILFEVSEDHLKAVAMEGCSEICLELGRFYMALEDYEEAAIWLYNAAYETTPILNIHAGGDSAIEMLAECYRACGNAEQADIYEQAKKEWLAENKNVVTQM